MSSAVARRGGIQSSDYWDVATVLELSTLSEDWEMANRAAGKAILFAAAPWNLSTTARNLNLIREVLAVRGRDVTQLEEIIRSLEKAAAGMRS